MTETPRTDAMLEANGIRCACSEKPIALCRELERELNAVIAERDKLQRHEDGLIKFINREMQMTATDPRVIELGLLLSH